MRRSSLPNLKDNFVVTQSNVRYPHSPNVSRSWSPRQIRVHAEERLARSVGDRGRERTVLEWCKKHNVNVIRKLPKLDSTILTSRGMNTEKFMSFVDEAKMVEREATVKPLDYSKVEERTPSAKASKNFCEFCQREIPKKRRRRPTFFTSPYECEQCGASNDIYDGSDHNVSSSDSEDDPTPSERVRDTIRRGKPAQVIDHRAFVESSEKSENLSEKAVDTDNDENEIFWRNDSTEFDSFQGNLEQNMAELNLNDMNSDTVFLTEATVSYQSNRPVEVKMAWDDDSGSQFAEISRTITTNDGIEDEVLAQESPSRTSGSFSEKSETYSENLENSDVDMGFFPESEVVRLSPTPPSQKRRGSCPIPRNIRYSGNHMRRNSGLEISSVDAERGSEMSQSPIANRSVGLTRVALMRLNRQSRERSRTVQSSLGTAQDNARIQEPRSHSHDSQDSYSFLDAVSPEIRQIHERTKRPDSSDS